MRAIQPVYPTPDQIIGACDENGYVIGTVVIDLSYIIHNDRESFLDLLSERLVGSPLLMDMRWEVDHTYDPMLDFRFDGTTLGGDEIALAVTGDVSMVLDALAAEHSRTANGLGGRP